MTNPIQPGATLLIAGAPGAGKGTQAKQLAERIGGVHLSSGDVIRKYVNDTDRAIMNAGGLGDEAVFEQLIRNAIMKIPRDIPLILDGMAKKGPREAAMLLQILKDANRTLLGIIQIDIDRDTSLARTAQRKMHRLDDDPEDQAVRLELFERYTQPSINALAERVTNYERIPGQGSREEVEALIWPIAQRFLGIR